ncbi:MAG: phage major capsid protein [Bacillota bacterium]
MDFTTLRQERAKVIEMAKFFVERAEAEKRDLSATEQREFDRLLAKADALADMIAEAEENPAERKRWQEAREAGLAAVEAHLKRSQGTIAAKAYQPGDGNFNAGAYTSGTRALAMRTDRDYSAAFWRTIRNWRFPDAEDLRALNRPELRALSIGTDPAGGFLLPESFERQIVKKLQEVNVMRTLATVLTLASDHKIPVESDTGVAAWIGEGQPFPESDPSFGQKLLTAHKLGRICQVSEELLQDSAIDLEAYLADVFGRSLATAEEQAFIAGDGVGKPRGILPDVPVGVTAASATAIAADEIIRLFHSVPAPYRGRATWIMNDAVAMAVRLLKDNTNQYLWQPGLQAGQPDRLLGRPVALSSAMPTIGANRRSIIFGDASHYWVAERQGRVFQILREKYADRGQVGFRMFQRIDGVLTLPDAVRALAHPAA